MFKPSRTCMVLQILILVTSYVYLYILERVRINVINAELLDSTIFNNLYTHLCVIVCWQPSGHFYLLVILLAPPTFCTFLIHNIFASLFPMRSTVAAIFQLSLQD